MMLSPFTIILIILQVIAGVIIGWSGFVAFFGLIRKKEPCGPDKPENRFAVIICARNEESVIRKLLKSLEAQKYPADHWHVYLLADHCTDRTASIARSFPFVTCYERFDGPTDGKGAVLAWGMAKILREKKETFDAFLVFDADNVATPDFMKRINQHLNKGNGVVQGNRLAGQPFRTMITQWYAAYWPLYSYIYSYPREKLGFSCFLTGTGFAVKKSLLEQYGWSTSSITEDVEFAFQQCLRGSRTSFCIDAVCYDEQPSSFVVMMRQLARWCTGNYQIFVRYLPRWIRAFAGKKASRRKLIDNMSLLLVGPASIVMMLTTILLNYMFYRSEAGQVFIIMQIVMFFAGYIFTIIGAAITARFAGIGRRKLMPGLLTFPVFLWLYTLCSLYSLLFPQKRWKPITHEGLTNDGSS